MKWLVAPTIFITAISSLRANMASLTVFAMMNTLTAPNSATSVREIRWTTRRIWISRSETSCMEELAATPFSASSAFTVSPWRLTSFMVI